MDPLVSLSWLAAHLADPRLVVLDATLPPVGVVPVVDTYGRYLAGHLPGAVFFDIDALSDHTTNLPHTLPSMEELARQLGALGIREDALLVVYEQSGVFSAPRAWWMLRTAGARDVHVLDGDLQTWMAAGYPIETGPALKAQTIFHPSWDPEAVRSMDQVLRIVREAQPGEQMVDARSRGRFTGAAPEPRAGLRSGHMPGALNVPFTELVKDGRLKIPADAQAVFTAHGVDLQRPITTTCGSGVTAAVLALALERCGVPQVRLYDGSWTEYAQHPDAEIVSGIDR